MNQKSMNPAIPIFERLEKNETERRRGSRAHGRPKNRANAPPQRKLIQDSINAGEILRFGTNKVNLFE